MKFSLGFSPCPNDTFIFDALVNGKLDTGDFQFEPVLEDVQTLNNWALEGKLDISKISYGVWPQLQKTYRLLDSGGALGVGVGPLLISKKQIAPEAVSQCVIAVPGINTTAHLLFSLAFPEAKKKKFMVFSEIENAVLSGKVDAGVIIHENRFTYEQKGLLKVMDLGEFWEQKTGCPIPLGGIVMKKSLDEETCQAVDSLIRRSVEFAFGRYPELPPYVREHANEMDELVMRKHIDLYVNKYSISLGTLGKEAVQTLLGISESFSV